jgi:hypothetical protein
MSTRGALAVVAAIVLAVGFLLAVLPVSSGGVGCGNAFSPSSDEASAADFSETIRGTDTGDGSTHVESCEGRVSTQRLVAFPLAGVGFLGLLFLGLIGQPVSEPLERSDP